MRIRKRLQLYLGFSRWYGQRQEDRIIAEYFGNFTGTLLSIGENDGITYSNVLYFLKRGWKADLVEPSPNAYKRLTRRHNNNPDVHCHRVAIGPANGRQPFYESGQLVNLGDVSLVSSLDAGLIRQWTETSFKEIEVRVLPWQDFYAYRAFYSQYDLISIDAEGLDLEILDQMDLDALGCRCLVIEHGGQPDITRRILLLKGFRTLAETEENIIAVKRG